MIHFSTVRIDKSKYWYTILVNEFKKVQVNIEKEDQ